MKRSMMSCLGMPLVNSASLKPVLQRDKVVVRDLAVDDKYGSARLTPLEIIVTIFNGGPESRALAMQVFRLLELFVDDSRLVLFVLFLGQVVQKLLHVIKERLYSSLQVDRILFALDQETHTHGTRRRSRQGKDDVTELLLGSQDVESRLRDERCEEGKLRPQDIVLNVANFAIVLDSRVDF